MVQHLCVQSLAKHALLPCSDEQLFGAAQERQVVGIFQWRTSPGTRAVLASFIFL